MTRNKLLSTINYALNHILYGEEREKEIKKAFKKMKEDLKLFNQLKEENKKLLVNKNVAQALAVNYKKKLDRLEKAVEVLKRFHLNVNETNHNNTGYEIWTDSLLETQEITQQEYELLKEVLESEKINS